MAHWDDTHIDLENVTDMQGCVMAIYIMHAIPIHNRKDDVRKCCICTVQQQVAEEAHEASYAPHPQRHNELYMTVQFVAGLDE